MNGPTLDEKLLMVTDLYEVGMIEADVAVGILREAAEISPYLSARMIGDEMARRNREVQERDAAAEQAMRDDDGRWTP